VTARFDTGDPIDKRPNLSVIAGLEYPAIQTLKRRMLRWRKLIRCHKDAWTREVACLIASLGCKKPPDCPFRGTQTAPSEYKGRLEYIGDKANPRSNVIRAGHRGIASSGVVILSAPDFKISHKLTVLSCAEAHRRWNPMVPMGTPHAALSA
jgi:hypothetical protein